MNTWDIAISQLHPRQPLPVSHHLPYDGDGQCSCCGVYKEPEAFTDGHKTCNSCKEKKADYRARKRAEKPPRNVDSFISGAKMTPEQVRAIRKDPRAARAVADEYGLSKSAVNRIRQRITWQHVE